MRGMEKRFAGAAVGGFTLDRAHVLDLGRFYCGYNLFLQRFIIL
jgi:hypothetical protein